MTKAKTKKLRSGFTTGAAAAAAAKGALLALLSKTAPPKVQITFLTGARTDISIHSVRVESSNCATATVIKDAGDDPDVTHRAEIGAKVRLIPDCREEGMLVTGGIGVGVVTKPGLEIPPGQPAINPGPLRMIANEINEVLAQYALKARIEVEVFVPDGEALARKTLNARLGILGGISILGTTGIERPMSHEAYLATIEKSLSVARACGVAEAVFTTGRRSERFAQTHWPEKGAEAFIQIGDFFKDSLEMAASHGFSGIILAAFFGKAVKMAQGIPHTHAARSALTLTRLARWTREQGGNAAFCAKIHQANTARHAFEMLQAEHISIIQSVGHKAGAWARRFGGERIDIRMVIFDFSGRIVVDQFYEGLKKNDSQNGIKS